MQLNETMEDSVDLNSEVAREERKKDGRIIAVCVAGFIIVIASYQLWIRQTAVLAGVVAPLLIMFIYAIWVYFVSKRDKRRRKYQQALLEASIAEALKSNNKVSLSSVLSGSVSGVSLIPNGKPSSAKPDLASIHKPAKVTTDKLTNDHKPLTLNKSDPKLKKLEKSPLAPQNSLPMKLDGIQYVNEKPKIHHKEKENKKKMKKSLSEKDLKVPKNLVDKDASKNHHHHHHHHKKDRRDSAKIRPKVELTEIPAFKKISENNKIAQSLETINEKMNFERSDSNHSDHLLVGGGKNELAKKHLKNDLSRNVEINTLLEFKKKLDMQSIPKK